MRALKVWELVMFMCSFCFPVCFSLFKPEKLHYPKLKRFTYTMAGTPPSCPRPAAPLLDFPPFTGALYAGACSCLPQPLVLLRKQMGAR